MDIKDSIALRFLGLADKRDSYGLPILPMELVMREVPIQRQAEPLPRWIGRARAFRRR